MGGSEISARVEQLAQPTSTVLGLLARRMQRTPDDCAYEWQDSPGSRAVVSWRELGRRVESFALGLMRLGCSCGARVAVFGEAAPESLIAELGSLHCGAVVVPLGASDSAEDIRLRLRKTEAAYVVTGSRRVAEMLRASGAELPALRRTLAWGGAASTSGVLPLGQLCLRADEILTATGSRLRIPMARPEDPAVVVFEKGERSAASAPWTLTHGGCHFAATVLGGIIGSASREQVAPVLNPAGYQDGLLPALACVASGASLLFPNSADTTSSLLSWARPTVVILPASRVEPLVGELFGRAVSSSRRLRRLYPWATRVLCGVTRGKPQGICARAMVATQAGLAHTLVYSRLRECFGGRLRAVLVLGQLPVSAAEVLCAARLPVTTVWGNAMCSGLGALGDLDSALLGSVGGAPAGSSIRAHEARELMVRGPHRAHRGVHGGAVIASEDSVEWRLGPRGRVAEDGRLWLEDSRADLRPAR